MGLFVVSVTSSARADDTTNFGAPRTVMVSVERVSPLVVLEADRTGRGRIDESRTLVGTLGETPTAPPAERLPRLALDYGIGGNWTVGGSMHIAHVWGKQGQTPETRAALGDDFGIAPRIGRVLRMGKTAVFWPRVGASYDALRTETGTEARLEGTVEGAFGFFPAHDVALTLTTALDMGLASSAPASPASTGRFLVTVGLTTALPDPRDGDVRDDSATSSRSDAPTVAPARALARAGRATISADRLMPLFDYAKPDGADAVVTSGTTHAFTRDRALFPRFAADVTMSRGLTFGTSFAFSLTPWENVQTYAYPQGGRLQPGPRANQDLHAFSIGVEPRVGVVRALSDNVAIWIRGGLTYEASGVLQQGYRAPTTTPAGTTLSADTYDGKAAHRLNLSADPELCVYVTSGFGVTVGPVLDVTLFAHGNDPTGYPHGLPAGGVLHLGAVAGALLSF